MVGDCLRHRPRIDPGYQPGEWGRSAAYALQPVMGRLAQGSAYSLNRSLVPLLSHRVDDRTGRQGFQLIAHPSQPLPVSDEKRN